MSKSLGNLITVRDALERYSADALRLFFLSSPLPQPPDVHRTKGVESQEAGGRPASGTQQPARPQNRTPLAIPLTTKS